MQRFNILVAMTSPDTKAGVIAESVDAHPRMHLVRAAPVAALEVAAILDSLPASSQCAVVLVGRNPRENDDFAQEWLSRHPHIAVMLVDVIGDVIRIALRDPRLETFLKVLLGLAQRDECEGSRLARIQWCANDGVEAGLELTDPPSRERPLLDAAIAWMRDRLCEAVTALPDASGETTAPDERPREADAAERARISAALDDALDRALKDADPRSEPLARVAAVLSLGRLEFRLLLLALAPEVDVTFQRCIAVLHDEVGRRAGTLGLYASLLGSNSASIRDQLAQGDALVRWLVFDTPDGRLPAADEPLRVDPPLVRWLLEKHDVFADDPAVRRLVRIDPWTGAHLVDRHPEHVKATDLMDRMCDPAAPPWLLLDGSDPAWWRAIVELGAQVRNAWPIRIELKRLAGLDRADAETSGRRVARLARLTRRPLILDDIGAEDAAGAEPAVSAFVATLARLYARAAVICTDEARAVRLLGRARFEIVGDDALAVSGRAASVRKAAHGADLYLPEDTADAIAARFPLQLDGLDEAMRLAQSRRLDFDSPDPRLDRFTTACKEVSSEGLSRLADRIEPVFDLEHVVLPADRRAQILEIVDNVRHAHRVLDEWKFGELLPYGRGVAVLFVGSSGTGKTMAALAVARRLGIQVLRFDLSRVVSKYIGDTEKNIDRVFNDARKCGAAVLVDEADALLGKRSEVKDSHDRYANIEVAYLLQRMEAHDGLTVLTTNVRTGLDHAFLRRLRFVVEFPRPDADARERIWRHCLPAGSHTLNDAAFRQLARRIDVTGGNIRQITLRAAFIAAAANTLIALEHVVHAAAGELAKLGMPAVEIDLSAGRQAA